MIYRCLIHAYLYTKLRIIVLFQLKSVMLISMKTIAEDCFSSDRFRGYGKFYLYDLFYSNQINKELLLIIETFESECHIESDTF